MSSFHVIRGKDSGQHFLVRGAHCRIGRGSSSQIRLNDTEVSRQHAVVLRCAEGEHEIADNSSSNGTFVNSRRIERETLRSGDRVQVGRTLLIYTSGPEPRAGESTDARFQLPNLADSVQIVAGDAADELSHIRRSVEGPFAGSAAASWLGSKEFDTSEQDSSHDSVSPDGLNEWEIVYQVGQAVSRTLDINDLLAQVLRLIFQWIRCDRGCIMLIDDQTGELTPACTRDRKRKESKTRSLQISRTILDHVIESKEAVLTSNAQDDSRWDNVESIASIGVQEALCVPMLGRYGMVGAIYVDTTMSPGLYAQRDGQSCFEEEHLKLMLAIAGQAALAIEDTQFYRAMLQSEKLAAMGQTIANLSHHVKNILQGVRGGSYLVDDGLKRQDFDVVQRGWSIVERNQERISNLVMDMLSFSKDREPDLQPGDILELVRDVIALVKTRADELGIEISSSSSSDEPVVVEFDCEAMHRALLNVTLNAIDAVADSEVDQTGCVYIAVSVDSESNWAKIDVADNGEGISPEDLEKIFAPFESSKASRGTGLGLPVSRKILREHGGDITVTSQPDEGTAFCLSWPAQQIDASAQTIAPPK